ncbi:MAG: ArsR/SmtB family transcription factor [Thermoleophilia bacterium]
MNAIAPSRDIFEAVANEHRRELLVLLAEEKEPSLRQLTAHFQMGRTAVSKHLTILMDAGLVASRKVGRETRYQVNPAPLRQIGDWISFYEKFWKEKIGVLSQILKEQS